MRIVVDVAPLSHPRTGVGNYIRGSLIGLAGTDHEVVAFAPLSRAGRAEVERALEGIDVVRALSHLPAAHALRTVWSRLGHIPVERLAGALDVFHFGDWWFPPQRGGVRSTMIHDLVPLHHPEWVHARTRWMHGSKYDRVGDCDVVMVNSRFTGSDVASTLGVPPRRIYVAYPGVGPEFSPKGEWMDLGRPYLLTVATLEPRKNLETLVAAHGLLAGDLALAVAGAAGWGNPPVLDAPGIVRLGYTPASDLPRLYRGASVVVYPSLFEGFGMPVVEAMACGVPVVASSHPSLDEACGDAAVRADPLDPEALAEGIRIALDRRDELVPLGLRHAASFTWAENARAHLAAWEAAA